MKKYINLLNIVLVLIIAAQFRVWMSGPFSGYLFVETFFGLALLCLGAYGAVKWNKHQIVWKLTTLAVIFFGLSLLFQYEPVVGFLLR